MLEGPLKSWIVHFLGQYVESETILVSSKLWKSSERLKLENLTLKKSVIPGWLPFRLKTGFIGQFEVDLPISAIFGSGSAKIRFSDVLIVLAPIRHDEEEQREEEESLIDEKLDNLEQDLVDRWQGPRVPEYMVHHESEGYFGVDGWLGRTITKLIDNLQVDVRNLHIRIEGMWYPSSGPRSYTLSSRSTPGTKFAVGVSLGALSAVTTPSNWRIDGFDENKGANETEKKKNHLVFKLISAIDLSAYVDPTALHFIHSSIHPKVLHSTLSRLREMGAKNARADWWNIDENMHTHRFLIAPIAVSLKLTMNTAAQHAQTDDPRYDADFHLSKLTVSLDDEQLSILNLVLDSFNRHEEWRGKVSDHLKAQEKAVARDTGRMEGVIEEYAKLWKEITSMKTDDLDSVKQSAAWQRLVVIERDLPFELVVSLRNKSSTEAVAAGERVPYASLLHEMGDAMGIPLPEISVSFKEGPIGLILNILKDGNVEFVRSVENSQCSKKEAVKPGLLLIQVNGKPLKSAFRFRSALDVQLQLDSMPGARVLTFRYPLVKAPEVTPNRLVSRITLASDDLAFRLLRAEKKKVLAKLVLVHPVVGIRGYGPDLFLFHQYDCNVRAFYLQNNSYSDGQAAHCIASSVTPQSEEQVDYTIPAFRLGMDYLHEGHPDAVPGQVNTYGSKISVHIGNSVVAVDEPKLTKLMIEFYEFGGAISTQYTDRQTTDSYRTAGETLSMTSSGLLASSSSTSSAPEEEITTSSYSYDFKIDQVLLFVSAKKKTLPPKTPVSQPSYRTLLQQLVRRGSSVTHALPQDWARATQAIMIMQRFIRGAIVRRRRMMRMAMTRSRSRWIEYEGEDEEAMGWLYVRDDTLAFRRWRRSWCHIDEDGYFSVHTDGSGTELLDEFKTLGCTVTLVHNVHKGPWGLRAACSLLEIRSSSGEVRKVLSSEVVADLEKWRYYVETAARNAATRAAMGIRSRDRSESTITVDSLDFRNDGNGMPPPGQPGFALVEPKYSSTAAEQLLMGGFTDVYSTPTVLLKEKSSWISISITELQFWTDVHRVSVPEQTAFCLSLGVQYLSVTDHRKTTNHGLLHVGDEFLGLKNGVLIPARIRSDRVKGGPFLAVDMTYRGAQASSTCFVLKDGLSIDLSVCGWFLPLSLYEVLFEVIDGLSVLWTDPTVVNRPTEAPSDLANVPAMYEVSALEIHVNAPIIEAYLEDVHCVAKLSLEKSTFGYKADAFRENAKLRLGPTALFVLTDEVALRLAQVEKCWMDYDLRLHRPGAEHQVRCELCADDKVRRSHRSIAISIGQVKLEADRRLELLFALLEALTSSEESAATDEPDDEDEYLMSSNKEDKRLPRMHSAPKMYEVHALSMDHLPTERMQSMQFTLDDPDLRPMYDHFGHNAGPNSPADRSRMSSASTAHNWQSQDNGQTNRSKPRSVASAWIPLLNYQAYIAILPSESQPRSRTLYRIRLRVGRVHDRVSLACTSIVFEVIKRSLSVVALDTYIPVMNFSVSDIKVQVLTRTEFTVDRALDASAQMSARYYNSVLADWEPFIEPWRAYARVKGDESEGGTSVELSAMERLNVNVTDALVRLLTSVAESRKKQVMYVEKRTPAAVAADGEAKKEDGRVCVLNNLGVPIRLANLNTSQPGTLYVEIRDGWSYPGYSRFHDVRVEVVMLPWWHPREAQRVESLRHKFSLPYGGAQSGVTPILRVDVSTFGTGKRNFVFDQITNRYVEVDDSEHEESSVLSAQKSVPLLSQMLREVSSGTAKAKWTSLGTAEINLVGSVMGSLGSRGRKLNRWYRLHDSRGAVTGEISVMLEFVPHEPSSGDLDTKVHEPDQVKDGQFLVFDPLKIIGGKESKQLRRTKSRQQSSKHIVLSHGLKASYVPPLALEVSIGSERCSLLCPLRRAGKFLIQGERVLAEVKVAQRDESRRVLLLSSPVQLKNDTSVEMDLWSCPTELNVGEHGSFTHGNRLSLVSTSKKISVPLSAMYGEEKHAIIVKVEGCKPTVVAKLGTLAPGSSIIPLAPDDGLVLGYCLFVNVNSYMRKVYREEHQEIVTRGGAAGATEGESQSYATTYQIGLHSCLLLGNTLPIRVQFRVTVPSDGTHPEQTLRTGTVSPGEDVQLHEFHPKAQLSLRLPEMDSIWSLPLQLGDCIYREGMDKSVKSMLGATGSWLPTIDFIPSIQTSGTSFKMEDTESRRVVARLDYTTATDGIPRVVLYSSLWIYNQSHVPNLLFRCADDHTQPIVAVPQLVPQRPVPKLMDCPGQVFDISTIVDHEVARWSEKIHTTVVGVQGPIALKFGTLGPRTRNEIGISIKRPLGKFHRTTQVIVTSRFVFVNRTQTAFKVSSYGRDSENVIEVPPALGGVPSSTPFDFDGGSNAVNRLLYLRMDHYGADWSGPFSVDEDKEFPLRLKGEVEARWNDKSKDDRYSHGGFRRGGANMNRVRIRIHTVGPTMVVSLMRDDPPMFLIRNESSLDLYVNQHKSSEDQTIIRSKEFVPFAWKKPEASRRVACRVGIPGQNHPKGFGSRVYDFNNLDREKGFEEIKYWVYGNQLRRISADIAVEESSRVLVFRDQNRERPPNYVLEVKVIATRFYQELSTRDDTSAEIILETDNDEPKWIPSKELKTSHVYRFDADKEFSTETRPKRLVLSVFQNRQGREDPSESISIGMENDSMLTAENVADVLEPRSPMAGGDGSGPFEEIATPIASPHSQPINSDRPRLERNSSLYRFDNASLQDAPGLRFMDEDQVSNSDASSNRSEIAENADERLRQASGVVEIKIPRKAWSKFGVGMRRSVAWSNNNMGQALLSMGRLEGHWWEMRDPESGELVGEVQVALKFRTAVKEYANPSVVYNLSVRIPSVGFSFLHSANSSLVEVAYLSLQRLGMVYSCVGDSSEIACSLGNLQMDNQMDAEVVLGPKVHRVKEGVSVRLRDRWHSFRNYRYRGIYEQLDTRNLSFIQFRMLWNSRCMAGDITHYELVEFAMHELEVSTDEKFVVNLITVFQGLGKLSSQQTFDDIVNTQLDYCGPTVEGEDEQAAIADGVYIEELDIDAIRVTFSMELNGGRHIKTLGPSGRRLAVYLPESNVKDFRLYFSNVTYSHLYESKASVMDKVIRRYQQQTVMLVLRGLHTVSVYANPIRIVYRMGHGVLEVVRLPARGLASGSPVELISGAYLGVRSLAMNTISAGYEILAGITGILAASIAPLIPESRRRGFEEEMHGFQRAVIEEVDSFDAAEERTMTKVIVRKPRVFDDQGVGLLTVYGPGSVPLEDQDRINNRAVVLLQQWWRRRRRASILYAEALRLRPDLAQSDPNNSSFVSRMECAVM
ncbi:hypothetical protein Poli38472_003236 [Pythium oligandrum]|uniref:PH domain-containing protein n=1 Tax=Pythium oligandrum TaxID=41045 RepID=A0A8K1C6H3_PYTOL|nr:hypothetical protein Poli38472_003236 [Pythium oligandrum]|eukprot:TMW57311.1 hypothetical protein Poli38472_003236 [Pythium oligandrum]